MIFAADVILQVEATCKEEAIAKFALVVAKHNLDGDAVLNCDTVLPIEEPFNE